MWFLEYLKASPSQHFFEDNELTGPKHCWSVYVVAFMLVFDEYETIRARKHLS